MSEQKIKAVQYAQQSSIVFLNLEKSVERGIIVQAIGFTVI